MKVFKYDCAILLLVFLTTNQVPSMTTTMVNAFAINTLVQQYDSNKGIINLHQPSTNNRINIAIRSSTTTTSSKGGVSDTVEASSFLSLWKQRQAQKLQLQQPPLIVSDTCQLVQLSKMTTVSIDSGDIDMIQLYANTGYITDATTNPLFVAQTAIKVQQEQQQQQKDTNNNEIETSIYSQMVDDAVMYAINKFDPKNNINNNKDGNDVVVKERDIVTLAMDRLAVNLGATIAQIVTGYISTEVDPRLSFNTNESIQRALRIIDMYENDYNISKDRILIKLAATWEGIMAAKVLREEYNIKCNLTLLFSKVQGIACGQYNLFLISPFPGRILDWYNNKYQRSNVVDPTLDEGVITCTYIYNYYKYYNHSTICMPASWRPSRGKSVVDPATSNKIISYDLDEIQALAGTDRMTIPVPLLEQLIQNEEPLPRKLFPDYFTSSKDATGTDQQQAIVDIPELVCNGKITEEEFRYRLTLDGCGNDKLAEGIRSFCDLTDQLEMVMTEKVRTYKK
jgi:transaldolase